MRVALFFDLFAGAGGAQRVALALAKSLSADVYTTFIDWNRADREWRGLNVNQIGLALRDSNLLTHSEVAYRFSKLRIEGYVVYLFLRNHCLSAASRHHPNLWICNSPTRLLYDLHEVVYKRLSSWQKPVFKAWCLAYGGFDRKWVNSLDRILANSKNVQARIREYYGRDSRVVYPPVEAGKYRCEAYDDFYLAVGRLWREKRFDLIIEAFKEMADKQLIIVGDGPERKSLEKLAKPHRNIRFTGHMDLAQLIELYSRCLATIYMPTNEDFGLVPLESMASGKPCIAADEGGCRETVVHNSTGFLIKPDKGELKKCVATLTPELAKSMRDNCINRAREFDVQIFIAHIRREISHLLETQ